MASFGVVVAKGAQNVDRLMAHLHKLPEAARLPVRLLFDQLTDTDSRADDLVVLDPPRIGTAGLVIVESVFTP